MSLDKAKAAMLIEAVLGRLPLLCELSKDARGTASAIDYTIRLRTISGHRICLSFAKGLCTSEDARLLRPDVDVVFLREQQACEFLTTGKGMPPVLVRGIRKKAERTAFEELGVHLKNVLEQTDSRKADELHVRALFQTILHSVCLLCQHDPAQLRQMQTGPQGTILFRLPSDAFACWINLASEQATWGEGQPPEPPDVIITFADYRIAFDALLDKLDNMAEVGRGRIEVRGNIPLAEQAGVLMTCVRPDLEAN